MAPETHVLSVGGSLVHPHEGINVHFLKRFYRFIKKEIAAGNKFVLIVGGGAPARSYQEAAGAMTHVTDEDKDWIGIHATRLNAQLLRTIFKREAHPIILKRREKVSAFNGHSLIIGAGWHPGWSTDFVAVQTAIDFGTDTVVNLGHTDHVYDRDHQKFKRAKPFARLSWRAYRKLIPKKWNPGLHAPIDPVAARLAEKHGVRVVVAGGTDMANIRRILEGKPFRGTTIE